MNVVIQLAFLGFARGGGGGIAEFHVCPQTVSYNTGELVERNISVHVSRLVPVDDRSVVFLGGLRAVQQVIVYTNIKLASGT